MPLHIASRSKYFLDCVALLIVRGANLEGRDHEHKTALHGADYVCAEYMLQRGANIEAQDLDGHTPLHQTCLDGKETSVELLLSLGADREAPTLKGYTPLHLACSRNHRQCAQLLLNSGSQVDAAPAPTHGLTPLMMACQHNHLECATLLLSSGANVAAVDGLRNTALHILGRKMVDTSDFLTVKLLIQVGADPNARNIRGRTPLHLLCAQGELQSIDFLLENGADVAATDTRENTLLHLAAKRGEDSEFVIECIIRFLLEVGVDRNARNVAGQTPRMVATFPQIRDLL